MRITTGHLKGRSLTAPQGLNTRPTSDRVRQAVFNILAHAAWSPFIELPRVIDLFAGSGAMGFEAISRGATFCMFIETDDGARGAIRDNIEAFDQFGNTRIHRRDATDLGPMPSGAGPAFDLAFIDAPYHKGLGEKALTSLLQGEWLAPDAIIVWEYSSDETPSVPEGFELLDTRAYGATSVAFLRVTA